MDYHKKIIAFLMSLLICGGAFPFVANAEEPTDGDDGIMEISLEGEEDEKETAEESEEIASGDYIYKIDDEGFAHIVTYRGGDAEVEIPESIDGIKVTEIETSAFLGGIPEKIKIPATIEYISANNPFAPCLNLTEVEVDGKNENYCSVDGVLFTKDMKKLMCYPAGKKEKIFTVPDGVESLGIGSFEDSKLEEIKLPRSLVTVEGYALGFSENLKKVDMSATSVESVEMMAFVNCTSLEEVIFSDCLVNIGIASFMGCESLGEVTLPDTVESIDQRAFMGTALKKIRIPSSVTYIGYSAFGYDMNENPDDSFTIIGDNGSVAQTYASDVDTEYDYKNNFVFVSSEVAEKEDSYNMMNPVSSEDGDYQYSVIDDETCCLLFCVSMDSNLEIPEEIDGYKVVSLYSGSLLNIEATTIIIPDTVETIEENVFSEYVESITISANCKEIQGDEPFISCKKLREINVTEGGDGEYSSEDGVLYNKGKTVLIAYPVMKEATVFKAPPTLTEIAQSAFCYNTFIEEADLTGVEVINDYAFEGCEKLRSVTFGKNLNHVGNDVFLDNSSLKSVRLPADIKYIGDYAFGYYYDSSLVGQKNENGEELVPFSPYGDFKIYAEEESLGWKYAKACDIEVVTGTVEVGEKNVDKNFLYVVGGIAGVAVLSFAGIMTGKSIKKKKKGGKKK